MEALKRSLALLALGALCVAGCPGAVAPKLPQDHPASKPTGARSGAQGLVAAASAFSHVKHDYILDPTSSLAPGRGLARTESGLFRATTTACARPSGASNRATDASAIDFGFVGVAIDGVLVGADVDLGPYLSAGASVSTHRIELAAIAFVREVDPQFFDATEDVTYAEDRCACAGATHFVGAVKLGGMLAYQLEARAGEAHGRALEFVKARIEANDATITETRVGGLEIDGLDASPSATKVLGFRVTNPVPLAYAVYPLADVCRFSLPAPEVTPLPLDFGELPYGREGTRLIHVVNRASIELAASFHDKAFLVPPRGSADLTTRWSPSGDAVGCEGQEREETIAFSPSDARVPVTPTQQTVRVVEHVRTGRPVVEQRERIDTGDARSPDYKKTAREWSCPADYAVASCRSQRVEVAQTTGYAITATPNANGCRFACDGPTGILNAQYCRFDAVMECRLHCH